jgi:hypothetical protein
MGHETWFLMLREGCILKVFENGTEENIWTRGGRNNRRLEENA